MALISGKQIRIGEEYFMQLEGHPTFGVQYLSDIHQYRIANVVEMTYRDFFFDDIIYSEKRLHSWTEDYIVVKLSGKYYLADNNGKMFVQNRLPYIVCRNGFVDESGQFFVNKNLRFVEFNPQEYVVRHSIQDIEYVFLKRNNHEILLTSNGEITFTMKDSERITIFYYQEKYLQYLNESYIIGRDYVSFIDDSFSKVSTIDMINPEVTLIGDCSRTYLISSANIMCYFSFYFNDIVDFAKKYGRGEYTIEYVETSNASYFFRHKEIFRRYEGKTTVPMEDDQILNYRQGTVLFHLNMVDCSIDTTLLSKKESYQLMLMERICNSIMPF